MSLEKTLNRKNEKKDTIILDNDYIKTFTKILLRSVQKI